jgi:hypothetical protein
MAGLTDAEQEKVDPPIEDDAVLVFLGHGGNLI